MTLYEKRGRRYIPVMDERRWDAWPHGFHLVHTPDDGGRSTRFRIEPESAGLQGAIKVKEDQVRKLLYEVMYMKPKSRKLTKRQQAAWKAFAAEMGNDGYIVEYESIAGIIDAIVEELAS